MAYVSSILDPANTGPTYSRDPYAGRANIQTPRYDALFLQRLPGGAPVVITDCRHNPMLGTRIYETSFDSTGQYIALDSEPPATRQRAEDSLLFVYDLRLRTLREVGQDIDAFWWSPSGSRLLVSSAAGSGRDISIYDADSRNAVKILADEPDADYPIWADDGKTVVYVDHATLIVEVSLLTGKRKLRGSTAYEDHVDASPYTHDILVGDNGTATELTSRSRHPLQTGLGTVDEFASWSPDGKLVAVRNFSADLVDGEPLVIGTDQSIVILKCKSLKLVDAVLGYSDSPMAPYRYHLLGWSRNQRWLLMQDEGDYRKPVLPWSERLVAYDRQTKKFSRITKINAWVGSMIWHSDG